MPPIPSNLSRVSFQMHSDLMLSHVRQTRLRMLQVQEHLSSGVRVNVPSDAPASVSMIETLQGRLAQIEQQMTNLSQARAGLNITDQALGEAAELLRQAQSIALSQIGVGATAQTRDAQAMVVDGIISQMLRIANREHQGMYLFAGESASVRPFVQSDGGIRYAGGEGHHTIDMQTPLAVGVNSNGVEAFGALSRRVEGRVDLNPRATASTRIVDVRGARGSGVELGTIEVTVNGSVTQVDLTGAATLEDVLIRVNQALGAAGSLTLSGGGFELTANAGDTIAISDIEGGTAAADLGIALTASSGTASGADLDPRLTPLTPLSALSASVDWSGGLKITIGATTRTVDFSGASTIQDVINIIEAADLGVRMTISDSGNSLALINELSGPAMSIGESGGTTAADLGLRTFAPATELSTLNHGTGVDLDKDSPDLRISLHDGTQVKVDLNGAKTVGDVIAVINAAGGGDVIASLASNGSGLVLTDTTTGGADFHLASINLSHAARDLGIKAHVGSGGKIRGEDVAKVRTPGLFTHLIMLRNGLRSNNEDLITRAGSHLREDLQRVTTARARTGVRTNRIMEQVERLENKKLQTKTMLSDLRDTDYAKAVSRFRRLQQQLKASLLVGRQTMRLTLLDFLR